VIRIKKVCEKFGTEYAMLGVICHLLHLVKNLNTEGKVYWVFNL
jgi:hypothetical protein